MTEWPWLMITLALISPVQWTNSIAEHTHDYYSYWEEYLWSPRVYTNHRSKRSALDGDEISTLTTTLKNIVEDQKIEPRHNLRNSNVKLTSSSNLTKSFKNEYPNNNSKSNGLKPPQTKSSSTVIFPTAIGEKEKVSKVPVTTFVPEPQVIEKCSMNDSFCIKVDNYPNKQDVLRIFRTSKYMSNAFFGVDAMNDLETRITTSLQPFCDSLEEVIFPEAGITKNNEWRFIIQDLNSENGNFKQGIRVEKCINAGESCKFSEHLPTGYTTSCVQKYIYKKLVAIKDSKEIYYESFKLPSCCTCMYSVNPDLLTRKNGDLESRRLFQNQTES